MSKEPLTRGEKLLPFDPAQIADDARLVFIGRIHSPWKTSAECPKNLREARQRAGEAWVDVEPAYRPALEGLDGCSHILLLYWLDEARRDLIIQRKRGANETLATFATRAPVRPNPIGVAAVRLRAIDMDTGRLSIDAIDCIDATPLIDIKPYLPSVDAFSSAAVSWLDAEKDKK